MNSDNRVDFLLNLILEGGPKNACTFWHILESNGKTRVVVEKTINKLKTSEKCFDDATFQKQAFPNAPLLE